jgi:hypothetical protein
MSSKITDKDKLSTALTGELLGTIRDFAEAEPDADSPDVVLVAVLNVFRLNTQAAVKVGRIKLWSVLIDRRQERYATLPGPDGPGGGAAGSHRGNAPVKSLLFKTVPLHERSGH